MCNEYKENKVNNSLMIMTITPGGRSIGISSEWPLPVCNIVNTDYEI